MSGDAAPLPLVDPLLGARLGEYQVLEPIGEGGMGVVYRGIQPLIKKRVAIKVLKPGEGSDRAQVRALLAEAEAVNAVHHRNIIDIFSFGQLPDGRPYVVMEFLDGQPLDAYLGVVGRPLLDEALSILADVASPLAAAHRAGVVHRDLKPSNVFLCSQDDGVRFVKLLDFGLALRAFRGEGEAAETQRAFVSGTPDYMAPEQARNEAITPRTDLYALGCMAYEMVTGQRPFTGVTPMDVMLAQTSAPVPRAAKLTPDLPPELDELIARLMAKKPAARPQSADEVRETLLRVRASLGQAGAALPPPRASGPRPGVEASPAPRASGPRAAPARAPTTDEVEPLPAPATPGPASPSAPAQQSPPPPRRLGPVLGALAGVLVIGVVAFRLTTSSSAPAPEPKPEAPSPITAPPPAALPTVPEPAAAPVVAAPTTPPASPPLPTPDEEVAPQPRATAADEKKPPPAPAPTAAQLEARLVKLEAALQAHPDADPSARQYLQKYRVESTIAVTPAQRLKLARSLDSWERTFLSR